MSEERRLEEMRRVWELLDLDGDISQDAAEAVTTCPLHEDCAEAGGSLRLNWRDYSYQCENHGESGSLKHLIRTLEARRGSLLPALRQEEGTTPAPIDAEYSVSTRASNPVLKTEPKVYQLQPEQKLPSPEEIRAEQARRLAELQAAEAERRRGRGERLIISLLALIFVVAGLIAAGLSGFANYQAFSSTLADPVQGRIWGWAGVIAAIISFGGFTFVYWHGANRRRKEALRALVFALVGAGASILGTEIYIRGNAEAAAAAMETARTNRTVLESQIADWRRQLEGIAPETRSVEGLEAYLAEVERVGRTDHKPYRDAQNELGLARRRDELAARIEAANAELLGQGNGNILPRAERRAALPSWLFAMLLEVFSSQATSIGFVALLLLAGARRGHQPESG